MLERIRKIIGRLEAFRSLRVIFFIIIFLVGVIPCILLQNGILRNYEERAVEVRVEQVKGQLRSLANHLISSNYLVNHDFLGFMLWFKSMMRSSPSSRHCMTGVS